MVDIYKISSSDLSNTPFIRHIAKKGKPIYISAGAAYLSEVEEAVRLIKAKATTISAYSTVYSATQQLTKTLTCA